MFRSIYFNKNLAVVLKKYAEREGITFNKAVNDLLIKVLKEILK